MKNIIYAVNGVFLPKSRGTSLATAHQGLHTKEYYSKVDELLRAATNGNKSKQERKRAIVEKLEYIAEQLQNGVPVERW